MLISYATDKMIMQMKLKMENLRIKYPLSLTEGVHYACLSLRQAKWLLMAAFELQIQLMLIAQKAFDHS
jgi:hypothetical protein